MTEQELFQAVAETAQQESLDVYVVGGYVRDALLAEKHIERAYDLPEVHAHKSKIQYAIEQDILDMGGEVPEESFYKKQDIDMVVLGSGLAFAEKFDQCVDYIGRLVTFPEFDTARYIFEDLEVEFAGARKEAYDSGSRKPDVSPATLEEDLSRRDFTVNAMAQHIESDGKLGNIVDPYKGEEDLQRGLLKTPLDPGETFSEDPLRMLRAARFAAQLGFNIEEKTYEAISQYKQRLEIVSKERILEEFMKLMATPRPSIGLWILVNSGLMNEFLPEVPKLDGVEEIYGHSHKNNLQHTFKVVDNVAEKTQKPLLRYAALMHDIGKPRTKKFIKGRGWTFDMHEHLGRKIVRDIGKRLKMSRDATEYVAKLVRWHQQPIQLMDTEVTDSAVRRLVVNLGDEIDDLMVLCRSDITTGNPHKLKRRLKNYDILEERILKVIEKDKLRAFQSPVRGDEIMDMAGLKPGPTVGKIKEAIEEAILEGEIPNEYDAAKKYFDKIKDLYLREAQEWEKS